MLHSFPGFPRRHWQLKHLYIYFVPGEKSHDVDYRADDRTTCRLRPGRRRAYRSPTQARVWVSAILHGAGISRFSEFREMELENYLQCIRVKATGLFNLLAAVPPKHLKALHVISSVLGRTGMFRQADYTFANAWLARAFHVPNIFIGSLRGLPPELFSAVLTLEPVPGAANNLVLSMSPSVVDPDQIAIGYLIAKLLLKFLIGQKAEVIAFDLGLL